MGSSSKYTELERILLSHKAYKKRSVSNRPYENENVQARPRSFFPSTPFMLPDSSDPPKMILASLCVF